MKIFIIFLLFCSKVLSLCDDYYHFFDCPDETDSPPKPHTHAPTQAPKQTTKAPLKVIDNCFFETWPNVRGYNGTYQQGVNSPEKCKALCKAVLMCMAADWDPTSDKPCWLYSYTRPNPHPTNTQYRKICSDRYNCPFEAKKQTHSLSGTNKVGLKTLEECMASCRRDSDCKAIDWDVKSAHPCWIHHKVSPKFHASSTQYTINCSEGARNRCTFKETKSIHSLGGTHKKGVETLEDCKKECRIQKTCASIDWIPNEAQKCWTHIIEFFHPYPGSTHYKIEC